MEQPSSYPLSVSALAPPLSHSTVAAVSSAEPIASVASSRVGREGEWRPADTARRVELERENGGGGRLIQDKSSNYKPTVDLPTRANMTTHIATSPQSQTAFSWHCYCLGLSRRHETPACSCRPLHLGLKSLLIILNNQSIVPQQDSP